MSDPTILLLAAGRATRMRGADKMLEPVPGPFGDQPLLQAMARRCLRAGPTRVILGPGQPERAALLAALDVEVLEAPEGAGMAASIVTGVAGTDDARSRRSGRHARCHRVRPASAHGALDA